MSVNWLRPGRAIGHTVRVVFECASTNDLATNLAPGEAVVAESQTAGRGQYSRAWDAPPGSSLLISVACGPVDLAAPVLTAWATVAVTEAVQALAGLRPAIKWPNDLLVDGRKICGILVERGRQVVIGVGLNLTRTREEFQAAGLPDAGSVLSESGVKVSARDAAEAVLDALDAWRPTPDSLGELEAAWVARLGLGPRGEVAGELFDGNLFAGRVERVGFAGLTLAGQSPIALELMRRFRPTPV